MATKETMEFLEGVKVLVVTAKAVFKDGKVSLDDLPVAMQLLQDFPKLNAAVQGLGDVPAEFKSLSQEDAQLLLAKLFEVINAAKAA